jgi:hypothetical protein
MLEALEESLAQTPLTKEELETYRKDPTAFIKYFLQDTWIPTKDQRRFLERVAAARAEGNIFRGINISGRGVGKTWINSRLFLWISVCWPGQEGLALAGGKFLQVKKLFRFIRNTILRNPRLLGIVEDEYKRRGKAPPLTKVGFANGSFLYADSTSESSARGPHVDILCLEEAEELEPELWEAAKHTVTTSAAGIIIVVGTPPRHPTGVAYDLWMNAEDLGFEKFNWSYVDQPYVSEKVKVELEKIRTHYPEEYAREVLGQFTAMTGAVWPTQKIMAAQVRDIPQLVPVRKRTMGIDWGFVNPTALIIVQQGDFGEVQVIHAEQFILEDYDKVLKRIVQLAKAFRIALICSDASDVGENQRLSRYLREDGVGTCVEPVSFGSEKMQMIEQVRDLLTRDMLKIPKTGGYFPFIVDQMIKYSWDPKVKDREKVLKHDDHYCDALMLAVKGLTRPRWVDIGAGVAPQLGGELITG